MYRQSLHPLNQGLFHWCNQYASFFPVDPLYKLKLRQNLLRRVLLRSNLLAKSRILEGFAYATPERNRVFGGPGHNATINYLYDQIAALGDYYDVKLQPFVELYTAGNASLKVGGVDQKAGLFTYSPSGKFIQPLILVANNGCVAVLLLPYDLAKPQC